MKKDSLHSWMTIVSLVSCVTGATEAFSFLDTSTSSTRQFRQPHSTSSQQRRRQKRRLAAAPWSNDYGWPNNPPPPYNNRYPPPNDDGATIRGLEHMQTEIGALIAELQNKHNSNGREAMLQAKLAELSRDLEAYRAESLRHNQGGNFHQNHNPMMFPDGADGRNGAINGVSQNGAPMMDGSMTGTAAERTLQETNIPENVANAKTQPKRQSEEEQNNEFSLDDPTSSKPKANGVLSEKNEASTVGTKRESKRKRRRRQRNKKLQSKKKPDGDVRNEDGKNKREEHASPPPPPPNAVPIDPMRMPMPNNPMPNAAAHFYAGPFSIPPPQFFGFDTRPVADEAADLAAREEYLRRRIEETRRRTGISSQPPPFPDDPWQGPNGLGAHSNDNNDRKRPARPASSYIIEIEDGQIENPEKGFGAEPPRSGEAPKSRPAKESPSAPQHDIHTGPVRSQRFGEPPMSSTTEKTAGYAVSDAEKARQSVVPPPPQGPPRPRRFGEPPMTTAPIGTRTAHPEQFMYSTDRPKKYVGQPVSAQPNIQNKIDTEQFMHGTGRPNEFVHHPMDTPPSRRPSTPGPEQFIRTDRPSEFGGQPTRPSRNVNPGPRYNNEQTTHAYQKVSSQQIPWTPDGGWLNEPSIRRTNEPPVSSVPRGKKHYGMPPPPPQSTNHQRRPQGAQQAYKSPQQTPPDIFQAQYGSSASKQFQRPFGAPPNSEMPQQASRSRTKAAQPPFGSSPESHIPRQPFGSPEPFPRGFYDSPPNKETESDGSRYRKQMHPTPNTSSSTNREPQSFRSSYRRQMHPTSNVSVESGSTSRQDTFDRKPWDINAQIPRPQGEELARTNVDDVVEPVAQEESKTDSEASETRTSDLEKAPLCIWDTPYPVVVEGSQLRTWSFDDDAIERVQVFLKAEAGKPLHATVDLWHGPDDTPQKMTVFLENGSLNPFSAVIETPVGHNSVAIENTADVGQSLRAAVVASDFGNGSHGFGPLSDKLTEMERPEKEIEGGKSKKWPIADNVSSVQVLLRTFKRPLHARVELLQEAENVSQCIDIFTEDGLERPFFIVMETPGEDNVVRIVNTAPEGFSVDAIVEPSVIDAPPSESMS